MKEVENIIRILKETKICIIENDSHKIKQLSNQTIHTATISQDPDNIIIAVLVYSIGKITEREHYKEMPGWKKFSQGIVKNIDCAVENLEKNQIEKFRTYIGRIRNSLNSISGNLSEYIKDVFRKAEINKAFKIYEHGLSAEQTAKLLGISLWDLSSYMGQSSISEASVNESLAVRKRIKFAQDIFAK
jgi:hypothetical protein